MDGVRTGGQPTAIRAIAAMIVGRTPHAVLLAGPPGVGKTTLALDLAAGLLCTARDPRARPCRDCRACRLVEHGNHPDLHRLGPEGPGRQVVIGGGDSKLRGVRDLVSDLALLPVEGGARVAVVEEAHRMNEDAQSALLKTLEEPPAGVTIVLCADEEDLLLPTVRSRCARVRLGPVSRRDIEAILVGRGDAEPPVAARLARLADGRPGVAIAYAHAPEAATIRGEMTRSLLDLMTARPSVRLAAVRGIAARAADLDAALRAARVAGSDPPAPGRLPGGRRPRGSKDWAGLAASSVPTPSDNRADAAEGDEGQPGRVPAAERRRAAVTLVEIWIALARDLAFIEGGTLRELHDASMLEDLDRVSADLPADGIASFVGLLVRAGELVHANVSPELILDQLALAWPARPRAA